LKSFDIIARPLPFDVEVEGKKVNSVVLTLDMADEENKATYDRDKLLEQGWYDEATLAEAEKTAGGTEGA
jgi:hypothetical protein